MDNEKRLILAIALSVLVIFIYQGYLGKLYKPTEPLPGQPRPSAIGRGAPEPRTPGPETGERSGQGRGILKERVPQEAESLYQEETVTIENELYRAVLTNQGAGIKELYLLQFRDKEGNPTMLSRIGKGQPLILETEETTEAGKDKTWQLLNRTDDMVVYKKEDGLKRAIKSFRFHNSNYIIELELNILNKTSSPQVARYKIIGGTGIVSNGPIDNRYIEADTQIAEKIYRRRPSHKSVQEGEIFYGPPARVSTKGRYFSFILKPEQPEKAAFMEAVDRKDIFSGVIVGPLNLAPNDEIKRRFVLYAGPNSAEKMAELGPTANNVISYGVFSGIASFLLQALKLFYRIFGNYGAAIIILSILISVVLFPLTRKSLHSMKEMQKIQPGVEKIRKDYSDNPQKMNREIMELYKKHKINPMGGCLPMFLQFPVFIALYQTLIRSVELKGANFLWIKDLSEPDSAFKLPYKLPALGDYINILPILMVLAMALQQKISQPKGSSPSEQQRMMSTIFPVFLGVIFYNLPSGLVLYWLTNTLLMLIMQELVLKSHPPT